ncbi:MAG TPA: R3H domain-containing nucleic acid-binding protein [Polyangiaceae bacterium]|nr:R3H domain-containing nucleic acid-binding protein [Polyangiaceae bacterium]
MSDTQDFSNEGWEDGDDDDNDVDSDDELGSADDGLDEKAGSPSAAGPAADSADGSRRRRSRRGRDREDPGQFDERARRAQAFVEEVVRKMGMDCRVRLRRPREDDAADEINLEILGRDAGRIIGKKGQVLQALQFLVHRVVNRPGLERRHILVDAEGYRSRRDNSLASMARRLGKQAVDEGKIITFEPMNPRDRRVVHLALAKFEGVITKSDGEGDQRRVQIIPVRRPSPEPS